MYGTDNTKKITYSTDNTKRIIHSTRDTAEKRLLYEQNDYELGIKVFGLWNI